MSEIEKYIAPTKLAEAVKVLSGGGVTIVAGGTDLTPQINEGKRRYEATLMNIQRVQELKGISLEEGEIRIGCLATVSEIWHNDIIAECAPILCDTANCFASDQIRNAATIGGNICNASPAGDMIIPLLVLGASVELARWKEGKMEIRREPLNHFFKAPGKTIRLDNELLTAVVFDKPSVDFVGQFRKSGPRPALEISTVTVGIGGDYNDGKFENVRVAFGAVGPTPLRAAATEQALEGKTLNDDVIQAAVVAAWQDARPIDDIRATTWYRNHLIGIFTEELLNNVCQN
ncbi:MAG: medium FAD-binding subunit of molybdenum enzyme [Alphaproteobacteria bacterium]|nr:MAG: medium FAD-binding subunit of molybdenum enzyme [Alphaproteobacteria bacterium]